jgi:hypothetical protein
MLEYPSNTNSSATTPNQLAEIKSLKASINSLVKQLNSPYTMFVSIVIFPLIAEILFHERLQTSTENFLKEEGIKLDQIDHYTSRMRDAIDKQYLEIFAWFKSQSKGTGTDRLISIVDQSQKPGQIDKYRELKRIMIQVYNVCIVDKNKYLDMNNPEQYSMRMLYDSMNQAYEKCLVDNNAVIDHLSHEISFEWANTGIYITKIFMMIAGKTFIIDPLFMRFFPNGIFQKPIPAQNNINQQRIAQKFILDLKTHKNNLSDVARRNVIISRYASAIILLSVVYFITTQQNISPEFLMLTLSFTASALTNLFTDFKNLYYKYYLKETLKLENENIKFIFKNNPFQQAIKLEKFEGDDLSSSHIEIFSKKKSFIKIIKNSLFFNKIPIISHNENAIFVSANISLSSKKHAIKDMCEKSLMRKNGIKKLKEQLVELSKPCDTFTYEPDFDKNDLPICKFELSLFILPMSEDFQTIQSLLTKIQNGDNEIQILNEKNNSILKIIITGFNPIKESMKTLNQKLREIKEATIKLEQQNLKNKQKVENPDNSFSSKLSFFSNNNNVRSNHESPDLKTSKTPVSRIVNWRSAGATYNSSNLGCKIKPICDHNILDDKFLQTTKFFIRNNLNPEQFPNADLFKAVNNIVENNPHFGDKIVKEVGRERNQVGNFFAYSLKIRPKGRNGGKGDMRAYAEAEINGNGEVLYTVKAVNFDAH